MCIFKTESVLKYQNVDSPTCKQNKINMLTRKVSQCQLALTITPSDKKEQALKSLLQTKMELLQLEQEFVKEQEYYQPINPSDFGIWLETYICARCICPFCKQDTLLKYKDPYMPAVDFMCPNHESPKLFQLKTSMTNNYFNKKNRYITTGTSDIGKECDSIRGSDMNKENLINYICVMFSVLSESRFKIHLNKSFIVIPDASNRSPEKYYFEITNNGSYNKPRITWNPEMCFIRPISDIKLYQTIEYTIFPSVELINPFHPIKLIKELKTEYLQLKQITGLSYRMYISMQSDFQMGYASSDQVKEARSEYMKLHLQGTLIKEKIYEHLLSMSRK